MAEKSHLSCFNGNYDSLPLTLVVEHRLPEKANRILLTLGTTTNNQQTETHHRKKLTCWLLLKTERPL